MSVHYADDEVKVYHGDCLDVLAELPDASVDAVVTDPPYGLDFMGKHWDTGAVAFDTEVWTHCLRVLKPGGHLLSFGGTRTWHRLAAAVEDAGFEIRDSIAWLYGSGFPKSHDVSRAIDKAGGDPLAFRLFAEAYATAIADSPLSHADVDRALGIKASSCFWARVDHRGGLPPRHHWEALCKLVEIPAELASLYDAAEREVIGQRTTGIGTGGGAVPYIRDSDNRDVTAPATQTAKQWEGWGTALKPSHEPLVVARKPAGVSDILATIGSQLDELENLWQAREADPTTRTGRAADSSAATDTSASESMAARFLSTVMSWRNCLDDLCSGPSTSTIATRSSMTTDLKTLSSCLVQITRASTTRDQTNPHGLTSLVTAADNLFASVVYASRATHALSVIESATAETPTGHQDAAAPGRPAFEPIVVARKPLAGTVAANVVEHGTGALNIDGCRVPGTARSFGNGTARTGGIMGASTERGSWESDSAGRWPTNVLLDGCQAAELDRQSGIMRDGVAVNRHRDESNRTSWYGTRKSQTGADVGYGGEGGASRFFPVFRYEAKAPGSERPTADGVAHPTVKPLDLMRWLVRLVTPPGGLVLDPFAGSGTTAEACVHEHMRCITIEREAEYLPLIVARLTKPIAVGFDFGAGVP